MNRAKKPCPKCGKATNGNCCNTDQRPSSYKRGYTKRWAKVRAEYLQRHPLCADCLLFYGLTRPAQEVHHTTKHQGEESILFDESAFRPLCKQCHSARTARGE